jgi:hypothetical protein
VLLHNSTIKVKRKKKKNVKQTTPNSPTLLDRPSSIDGSDRASTIQKKLKPYHCFHPPPSLVSLSRLHRNLHLHSSPPRATLPSCSPIPSPSSPPASLPSVHGDEHRSYNPPFPVEPYLDLEGRKARGSAARVCADLEARRPGLRGSSP